MNTTTPNNDFIKEVVSLLINALPNAIIWVSKLIWEAIKVFIHDNLMSITIILSLVLLYAVLRALMGNWRLLGSVLYKYLYWGSGLLIAFVWGPEIYASDYIDIILYVVYLVCFTIVGIILRKSGFRKTK